MALIDLQGVSKTYRLGGAEVRALQDVDLRIEPGEHVSKREAARWAASQMPDFATLIENALVWRERSRAAGVTDASTTEGETRRFILAVAATVC